MLFYLPFVACLFTYYVFNSKGIDYRAVGLGALLPITIDLIIGEVSFGHSFLFPVLALVLVMLLTIGKSRMLRRRLLCVVIGIFLALVLEGTFINESTWWWPLGLRNQIGEFSLLPSATYWIIRDVIGLIALYILVAIGELHRKEKRQEFFKTGRITS